MTRANSAFSSAGVLLEAPALSCVNQDLWFSFRRSHWECKRVYFAYRYPPYWHKATDDPPPTASPTPSQSPRATNTPTPSPSVIPTVAPSPRSSVALVGPTPAATALSSAKPPAPDPTPTPLPIVARRANTVLLLIDDEEIVQALTRKLTDYGLDVTSGEELPAAELARIRNALAQAGQQGLRTSFAVVVTGKISVALLGLTQPYIAEANGALRAIMTNSDETLRATIPPFRGGGSTQGAARKSALREAGQNIPQIFISQSSDLWLPRSLRRLGRDPSQLATSFNYCRSRVHHTVIIAVFA